MRIGIFNNYSDSHSYFSQPKPIGKKKIEIARKRLLKREGGMGNLPGLTHAISVPLKTVGDIKSVYTAVKLKDEDSIFHTILRLFQNSTAYFSAIASVMVYLQRFLPHLGKHIPIGVEMAGAILGLVACAIEAVIEAYDFARASFFRGSTLMSFAKFLIAHHNAQHKNPELFAKELEEKHLPHLLKYLTPKESAKIKEMVRAIKTTRYYSWAITCKDLLETISMASLTRAFAEKYFDEADFAKRISLERIVGIPTCDGLDDRLWVLAHDLANRGVVRKELKEARDIFQYLDDQAFKKQIIHVIGFCTAVITGLAIGLGMFTGVGTAVIISLMVLALLFALSRYAITNGLHSHKGWSFTWTSCLPAPLHEKINAIREKQLKAA